MICGRRLSTSLRKTWQEEALFLAVPVPRGNCYLVVGSSATSSNVSDMTAVFSRRFKLLPGRLRYTPAYPQFADWASSAPRGPAARRLDGHHKVGTPTPPPQPAPGLESKRESLDRRRGEGVGCNVQINYSTASITTKTSTTTKWKQMKGKVTAAELKRLMREYGPIAVGFHLSVFLTTLGGFYSLIDYGLDVASLVKSTPFIADNLPHPSAGNLALAWGMTTVTGPFRGVMTVTLTPRVARFWRGREAKRKLKSPPEDEGGKGARWLRTDGRRGRGL